MNDFLEKIWLGNTVRSYLAVLVVMLFIWVFKRYISRYFAGLIFRLFNRIWKNLDKTAFIKLVVQPLGVFLFILVSIIALHKLKFPGELNVELYDYSIKVIVHCIGTIIFIISF